ncbi:50S ribosomal protein L11 methyltransferase [Ruminococcaceae bacterium OttesenSCG-928-L11]|nr:50S ribosomal protein L11 methyltransferase [Ruminococcaceae bacterium OttesenSCG-928-L11]
METTNWTQVDIFTTTVGLEPVGAALMDVGFPAFAIQDAADFEQFLEGKNGHWDYIDDDLMKLREAETTITVYLPDNQQGVDGLAAIREMLLRLKGLDGESLWGRLECQLTGVQEEDWAFAWKKYYKPVKTGERLVICPSWEEYMAGENEVVMRLDPGMAFGTGTHDSTRLCLGALEDVVTGGEAVLDIGCGSGILSIGALLLGAGSAVGVDIDQVAVRVAGENAELNGLADKTQFHCGDLAEKVTGQYDIVCANIVADIIMRFAPDVPRYLKKGGHFLTSGIIDARADEVLEAVKAQGFTLKSRRDSGGWVALLFVL